MPQLRQLEFIDHDMTKQQDEWKMHFLQELTVFLHEHQIHSEPVHHSPLGTFSTLKVRLDWLPYRMVHISLDPWPPDWVVPIKLADSWIIWDDDKEVNIPFSEDMLNIITVLRNWTMVD